MKVEIDLDEYLTQEDKREIAREEFRQMLHEKFTSEQQTERLLGNLSYHIIGKMVDEQINGDHKKVIFDKVTESIANRENWAYHIFRRKDVWEKEDSLGQRYVNEAIMTNKHFIAEKVETEIQKLKITPKYLKELVADVLLPKFLEWMKK